MMTKKAILFVNKSASDKSLSHSEAREGVDIRSFIQRRNRRIQHERDSALLSDPFHGHQSRAKRSRQSKINRCAKGLGNLKGWVFYSAVASIGGPHMQSLTPTMDYPRPADKDGGPSFPLYNLIQERASWSSAELRASHYFKGMIASRFTSSECLVFWSILLPCIVEEDCCVRLLVMGLSLTHEFYASYESDPQRAQACHEESLMCCNKAIRYIRNNGGIMSKTSLNVTCILIVSIEMLRGNVAAAKACLEAGLAMSKISWTDIVGRRWRHPISVKMSASSQHAIEVTQAKMSGAFYVFGVRPERSKPCLKYQPGLRCVSAMIPFTSLEDVNTTAELLYSAVLRAVEGSMEKIEMGCEPVAATTVSSAFENFHYGLALVHTYGVNSTSASEAVVRTKIQEAKVLEAQIMFNCMVLDDNEMLFDDWNVAFEKILDGLSYELKKNVSEASHLTYHPFSAVFIAPLWLVASRCRMPSLRRRAIRLLRTYRRRETVYDSTTTADIAQLIMNIEEGSESEPQTCSDIPRSRRVKLTAAKYIPTSKSFQLEFTQGSARHAGSKTIVQEWTPCGIVGERLRDEQVRSHSTFLEPLLLYSNVGRNQN